MTAPELVHTSDCPTVSLQRAVTALALVAILLAPALAADNPKKNAQSQSVVQFRGGPERTGSISGTHLPRHPIVLGTIEFDAEQDADPGEPILADGSIYVGIRNGTTYAFNLTDGSIRWQSDEFGIVHTAPVIRGERLYVASEKGLSAVNRVTGKLIWHHALEGSAAESSPLLVKDRLIIADYSGRIRAVEGAEILSSPITDGRRLIFTIRRNHEKKGQNAIVIIGEDKKHKTPPK